MVVRGAPAIGVTAAWGCALALNQTSGPGWATQQNCLTALQCPAHRRKPALGR